MLSPRPVPPWVAGGRRVGLRERLEQPLRLLGVDADPGVGDLEAHAAPAGAGLALGHAHGDLAQRGELDRVGDQVRQHLLEPEAVADHLQPRAPLDERAQVEALAARVLGQQLDGVVDGVRQRELGLLQLELAGLDLRQVEDVVDDRQQLLAGGVHHRRVAALLVGQLGAEQQLGHPDHAVHRGAQLVAHVGEELRLQRGRLERLVARRGQRERRALALDEEPDRHPDGGQQLAQLLVGLLELAAVELHRAEAVLAADDRQADRARQPGRGDRDRALGGGARHQRLGPHRVAGVRDAHRQVLERERRGVGRQLTLEGAVAPGRGGLQLAALVVGQPQRPDLPAEVAAERLEQQRRRLLDGRRLGEHARDVVAGAQQLLAARLLRDVLELHEELGRPAAGVGQRRGVDEHPARLPVARQQPALRLVGADLAREHALEQALARGPLVGVDGLGQRHPQELRLAAAGELAQRGVDLGEAPVGADHRHPGRGVHEGQRGRGVAALGHDAADRVRLSRLVEEGERDGVLVAHALGRGVGEQQVALEVLACRSRPGCSPAARAGGRSRAGGRGAPRRRRAARSPSSPTARVPRARRARRASRRAAWRRRRTASRARDRPAARAGGRRRRAPCRT